MPRCATFAACLLAIFIAGCGSSERPQVVEQIVVREPGEVVRAAAPVEPDGAGILALGEDVFQTCKGCHTIDAGAPAAAGPNLHAVVGRVAGSAPDYPYSDALLASQVVWDEQSLDGFLADPGAYLPGTDMLAGAVRDEDRRAAVIAYLQSQGAGE